MTVIVGGSPLAREALEKLVLSPGTGQWAHRPDHIEIGRDLAGGKAGAQVFEIAAVWGSFTGGYVVKLGDVAEMRREWAAFVDHLGMSHTLCAPIEAATPVVRDQNLRPVAHRPEAIVYRHVKDYAGLDRGLATLEELAEAAVDEGGATADRFVEIIELFGEKARSAFYQGARPYERPSHLRHLTPSLGDWLTLRVDGMRDGRLVAGDPSEDDLSTAYHSNEALLDAGLQVPGERDEPIFLDTVALDGDKFRVCTDWLNVGIKPQNGSLARNLPGSPQVYGRVVGRYAAAQWKLIKEHLTDPTKEDDELILDGAERTFLPFARLAEMLRHEERGRPLTLAHGDLNPRNLLVVRGQPFVIDYAKTGDEQPLAADFTWLEIGLLRDVLAARLDFGRLLQLQRTLAVAGRALTVGRDQVKTVTETFVALLADVAPDLVVPFRMLWAVRVEAWRSHPEEGNLWWRDYLVHLTISANRTLKWRGEVQGFGKVAASAAAAGAATEACEQGRPYRFWNADLLREVTERLIPILDRGRPDAMEIAAALIAELDLGGGVGDLEPSISRLRAEVVTAVFRASAERLVERTREEHARYFDLDVRGEDGSRVQAQTSLADCRHVYLLGGFGAGKTAVLRELRHRLADATVAGGEQARFPLLVQARDLSGEDPFGALAARVPADWAGHLPALLRLGAFCVLVDTLDEPEQDVVHAWLDSLVEEYPRTAVVSASRSHPPESGPFGVRLLRAPDPTSLRLHLAEIVEGRGAHSPDAAVNVLLAGALDGDDTGVLLRLIPLAVALGESGVPERLTEAGLADACSRYLGDLPEGKETILETVARELTDRRLQVLPHDALAGHEPRLVTGLLAAGPLTRGAAGIGLEPSAVRDYLAARWLNRQGPDALTGRVRSAAWLGAFRMLLALPDTDKGLAEALLQAMLDFDPVLVAGLLRVSQVPHPAVAEAFLDQTRHLLTGPAVPDHVRQDVAAALVERGSHSARELFHAVAVDRGAPPSARSTALTSLAEFDSPGEALLEAADTVLAAEDVSEVQVAALNALGSERVTHLIPRITELLDPTVAWPVVAAAHSALRAMNARPTAAMRTRWTAACAARLTASTADFATAVTVAEQQALKEERLDLVDDLADADRHDLLLTCRFHPDLSDHIAGLLAARGEPPNISAPSNALLADFVGGPEPVAVLAAHRLLQKGKEGAERLVEAVDADAPVSCLMAAAAAVTEPLDGATPRTIDRVATLAESSVLLTPERVSALAALVGAVFAVDRRRGVRLALRAGRALEDGRIAERWQWPWTDVFSRARGLPEEWEELLEAGGDGPELAVFGLAGNSFLLDASEGPGRRFAPRARERFLALMPAADEPDAGRYVFAAATAGVCEVLEFACGLLERPGFGTEPFPLLTGTYGYVEETALAETLAAVGYLGWLAARKGERTAAEDAAEALRRFEHEGRHPSVRLGHLAGLAYTGGWRRVLESYTGDEPRVHRIAEHAVTQWRDNPAEVAAWITERLETAAHPPEVAFTLRRWRRACQEAHR